MITTQAILDILCASLTPDEQAQAILMRYHSGHVTPDQIVDIICDGNTVDRDATLIHDLLVAARDTARADAYYARQGLT